MPGPNKSKTCPMTPSTAHFSLSFSDFIPISFWHHILGPPKSKWKEKGPSTAPCLDQRLPHGSIGCTCLAPRFRMKQNCCHSCSKVAIDLGGIVAFLLCSVLIVSPFLCVCWVSLVTSKPHQNLEIFSTLRLDLRISRTPVCSTKMLRTHDENK